MSISQNRLLQVLAVSALALGLSACGPSGNDSQTAGQKLDNAIEKTEQAADNAKVEADRAAETAGQKIDNAVEATKDAATNAADATKDAVANAADAAGDAGITAKVNAALVGDAELSALKINVDTKDGAVTLNGEAPNQAAKDRAEQMTKAVDGVKSVNNLLTVK
ncbi:BON domain-containing protein [Comamonas sp.]|uniref:BON domain-containing protein n=1 Tax=Comamonas sp. TaxID=34028 RepID=UPI00289F780E|nr:BON domain-containing protein [Comamonas sp.]